MILQYITILMFADSNKQRAKIIDIPLANLLRFIYNFPQLGNISIIFDDAQLDIPYDNYQFLERELFNTTQLVARRSIGTTTASQNVMTLSIFSYGPRVVHYVQFPDIDDTQFLVKPHILKDLRRESDRDYSTFMAHMILFESFYLLALRNQYLRERANKFYGYPVRGPFSLIREDHQRIRSVVIGTKNSEVHEVIPDFYVQVSSSCGIKIKGRAQVEEAGHAAFLKVDILRKNVVSNTNLFAHYELVENVYKALTWVDSV